MSLTIAGHNDNQNWNKEETEEMQLKSEVLENNLIFNEPSNYFNKSTNVNRENKWQITVNSSVILVRMKLTTLSKFSNCT